VPAALENTVSLKNVKSIKACWVVEVANGPLSPAADAALFEKGVIVIPDVLANAGGVIVSYFEWVQNQYGYPWSLEKVRSRLEEKLHIAFEESWQLLHKEDNISLRTAVYRRALLSLEQAYDATGNAEYFAK